MTQCPCIKEEELALLNSRIVDLEKEDIKHIKDLEAFKDSLDRLNKTLEELKKLIDSLNRRPLEKYESIAGVVVGTLLKTLIGFLIGLVFAELKGGV